MGESLSFLGPFFYGEMDEFLGVSTVESSPFRDQSRDPHGLPSLFRSGAGSIWSLGLFCLSGGIQRWLNLHENGMLGEGRDESLAQRQPLFLHANTWKWRPGSPRPIELQSTVNPPTDTEGGRN
jgi:hypothetical protein